MYLQTEGTIGIPITKEFLEEALKQKINHFELSRGTNPGDNFATLMISIKVYLDDVKDEPLHLLLKTFPTHPARQKMLEQTNVLLKEKLFYDVWAKELVNFQKDAGNEQILEPAVPPFVAGAAIDYMKEEIDPEANPSLSNFILMVDVRKTMGFKMANKLISLGYHHVKAVLEELARLHALSYAYRKSNPSSSSASLDPFLLEDPFFTNPRQTSTIHGMASGSLPEVSALLKEFFQERPEIGEVFKKRTAKPQQVTDCFQLFLRPNGVEEEMVEGLMRIKPEDYSAPPLKEQWIAGSHGDIWTNNVLFKTDDTTGKVTDAILVDLQFFRESCIMGDLAFFLYTSTDAFFRSQYLDEMLTCYYHKFMKFCEILKVQPWEGFTLPNVKRKFHRSKILGFYFALVALPIHLTNPANALDMDSMTVDGDDVGSMFANMAGRDEEDENLLRSRFVGLLTELYDEGVL